MTDEPFDETKSESDDQPQVTPSPLALAFKNKLEAYCTGESSAYVDGKVYKGESSKEGNLFQFWIRKAIGTSTANPNMFLTPLKNPLSMLSSPKKKTDTGASLSRIFDAMQILPEGDTQFEARQRDPHPQTHLTRLIHEICHIILNESMNDLNPWMIGLLNKGEPDAYERLLAHLEPADETFSNQEKRTEAKQRLVNEFIGAVIAFCPQKMTDIYDFKQTDENQTEINNYKYQDIAVIQDAYANRTTTPETIRKALHLSTNSHLPSFNQAKEHYQAYLQKLRSFERISPDKTPAHKIYQILRWFTDKYQEIETAPEHRLSLEPRMQEFLAKWSSSQTEIEQAFEIISPRLLQYYETQLPDLDHKILSNNGELHNFKVDPKKLHKILVAPQQKLSEGADGKSNLMDDPGIWIVDLYQALFILDHLSFTLEQLSSDKIDQPFIHSKILIDKQAIQGMIQSLIENPTLSINPLFREKVANQLHSQMVTLAREYQQQMAAGEKPESPENQSKKQAPMLGMLQQINTQMASVARSYQQSMQKIVLTNELIAISNLHHAQFALLRLKQYLSGQNELKVLLPELNFRIDALNQKEKLLTNELNALGKEDLIYLSAFKYAAIEGDTQSPPPKDLSDLLLDCVKRIQQYTNPRVSHLTHAA